MTQSVATKENLSFSLSGDSHLYEYFTHLGKASGIYSKPPQGEILFSGVDHPLFNWAYNLSLASPADIPLLKKQFLGKPATWIASDFDRKEIRQFLEEGELQQVGTKGFLLFDLTQPLPERKKIKGLEIVKVQTHQHYLLWCELSALNFQQEPRMWEGVMKGFPKGTDSPGAYGLFLALLDGRPVGASSLYCGKALAGIYWESVHPHFRGQGIGTEMVLYHLNAARQKGYKSLGIFASPAVQPLWEKLGFRKANTFYLYIPPS